MDAVLVGERVGTVVTALVGEVDALLHKERALDVISVGADVAAADGLIDEAGAGVDDAEAEGELGLFVGAFFGGRIGFEVD